MIDWKTFALISLFCYVPFVYVLRHWYVQNWRIPIFGNRVSFILLTILFCGFFGIIFQGGSLIEKIYLIRCTELQMSALFFGLLYGFTLIKLVPTKRNPKNA